MNKKFLSAVLFGALMVTSTGTFVSCKDYDDDIENLQTQIDANKNSIAELQKLVGQGKWVSGISSIENGFTVTMSDGTTVEIKGINGKDGKDGKNGTEWTIGEDGMWYMDGEKTEYQAVAKDGQNGEDGKPGANGVSAPSPEIVDGVWVVYKWDAEAGEFKAESTGVPAQGTGAYAVTKDGVVTLHIADQNGVFQDVVLPATSDAFTAEAPASIVAVQFAQAKWNPSTSKKDVELFDKLKKAFPEIANYKKNDVLTQGGNLPVLITPANVELTNNFSFSLQNMKGKFSDAVVSNPVKGLPSEISGNGNYITTRAAEANDCFWTLSVEPAKDKNGKYVQTNEYYSLAIENEKGTVVKTGFAYRVDVKQNNENVSIGSEVWSVEYADEIDVLAAVDVYDNRIFTIYNGLNGHYVLEATEAIEVEKYGLKIEGSKLIIGNMPSDQPTINIHLKLTALGLNGSVASCDKVLRVGKAIEASGNLADKTVTLSSKDNYVQTVKWNIADLGLSTVQLDQFLRSYKLIKTSWVDENGNDQYRQWEVTAYDKDGAETFDYKKAVTFGIDLNSQEYLPGDYSIRLEAMYNGAVIYAADATLTLVNPTSSVIKLAEAAVENGVLQITGRPDAQAKVVKYNLMEGLVYKPGEVTIVGFEDMDAKYDEDAWVKEDGTLTIDAYDYNDKTKQNLYKTRNFKVTYQLFGNAANTAEFEFQAQVVSEIYNADATQAIVMDDTKLSAVFDGPNNTYKISLKNAITKAVYAAGANRGKSYNLFMSVANGTVVKTYDYSAPLYMTVGNKNYVVKGKDFVALPNNTDALLFDETLELEAIIAGKAGHVTVEMWGNIWEVASKYYKTNGELIDKDAEIADDDKKFIDVYKAYVSKIDFTVASEETIGGKVTPREINIEKVELKFVDATAAAKYATINASEKDIEIVTNANFKEDIPSGKVELPMQLVIVDAWGMKMVRNFTITLTTK